ncbi:hypothetical protein H2198_001040 [Neophaeococcomyces mojaviensis]|uniref:Uncharacterized protein n=1 Tax=Neophaeococcomyces mojaviensis TaxID=3383035 RepID=A0ACC3AI60_9EURO|nr:hypothetical protein H2198_001040 [Knufia sp. JES_112]
MPPRSYRTKSTRQERHSSPVLSSEERSSRNDLAKNLLEETDYQSPHVDLNKIKLSEKASTPSLASQENANKLRLVVAIDYGTTFTGVAFANTQSNVAQLSKIEVMQDWGSKMGNQHKLPSVYSYVIATNGEEQWGTDISENAVTMVNTKLELEVQDKKLDELELTLQVLEGTGNLAFEYVKKSGGHPAYTWKTPTEIVTDYLTKARERVWNALGLDHLVGTNNIVGIIVTVPVNWSYQATESTFRAMRQAGFNEQRFPTLNDMVLVSEPEAASYFTARDLQDGGKKFLKLDENFILCDAGGGTVDVVAYQVKTLQPHLELAEVSLPTNGKCGASYIDANFKRWLRKVIGPKNFRELDAGNAGQRISTHATESGPMRQLVKEFEVKKKSFSSATQTIKLDLPGPLSGLTIEGRNVFLVGGFGESVYLQEELQRSLKMRRITMRRPETKKSWTAVVQGAVIYGIEKDRHKNLRRMFMCTKSYGILINEAFSVDRFDPRDCFMESGTKTTMAGKQFAWLIRRGDLILSDEDKKVHKWFSCPFQTSHGRKFDLPVYVYPRDDDDDDEGDEDDEEDDVPDRWENGQHGE